jgi:hypothetical protein
MWHVTFLPNNRKIADNGETPATQRAMITHLNLLNDRSRTRPDGISRLDHGGMVRGSSSKGAITTGKVQVGNGLRVNQWR